LEAFEELSAEIMQLLQAQINALELDRVLTAKQLYELRQKTKTKPQIDR